MPGPTPKAPATRQRRNRETSAASLIDTSPLVNGPPELKARLDENGEPIEWHPSATEYWQRIWESPMATEYTEADVEGLVMLMDLVDRYWRKPSTALAAEIRLQRQCYGLTSIDRRRLQWEIKRVETEGKKEPPKRPERKGDPRAGLRAVK